MTRRIVFLDILRVVACFMVIMVHSCEFFFIDGDAIGIRSLSDGFWVSVIDSAFRCSVPLFVMISAYLLVPVRENTPIFFKKRLIRVVIPFAIWSVLYATLPYLWGGMNGDDVASAVLRLTYNFNNASGHMWFVYMLVGLYLFMPVISPWLRQTGSKGESGFIALWFIASFFPYLRDWVGDIYGECYWNEFNLLWYFSGFLGYVVLSHYIRTHLKLSRGTMIVAGVLMYAAGYYVTSVIWYGRIATATTLQELELSWRFCTPNVIIMSAGVFMIAKALWGRAETEPGVVKDISVLSYGIYLMHIFVLGAVYSLAEGRMSTPLTIVTVGVTTFVICYAVTKVLSILPGSKYIVG